ncbi:MAG: alcohol dehydrogenase [Pseudomonadaceae bacterium]|nr:alcohol dehydrogenase [Pseudomonadaceae bacterium]
MTRSVMKAIVTTGNGGYEKLVYQDVPMPVPLAGEVLLKVLAAGVNNTEINTRLGWYSSAITESTNTASSEALTAQSGEGGWNAATPFPFIQGTDCCGEVVAAADDTHGHLLGKRVLVRACMRENGFDSLDTLWMGSDFDGAFAQYVKVPASEVFPIDCEWSDAELGTIPCAYGTAENMLHRANLQAGERVLIMGASGGVGVAALQLAKRRGATVIAVAGAEKLDAVAGLGADQVISRSANLLEVLGENAVDLVVDNVAGANFPVALKVLKRGGRLVSSGAIAGPVVALDMRDMYLKDITLIGTTAWDEPVFANLVRYIEQGEISPVLAETFALQDIVQAQQAFLQKRHVGKFVLIPSAQ